MITLTENAAKQINSMRESDNIEESHLRLYVEKGGCSGFEYGLGFDNKRDGDMTFESAGINITMDPQSAEMLKGTTIDFDDGLNGKGFEITNPNAENTCGCGKSFH